MWLNHPVLSLTDLEVLKQTSHRGWNCHVIDTTFNVHDGPLGLSKALHRICEEAEVESLKHQLIILSDRRGGPDRVPVSSLLALGNEI